MRRQFVSSVTDMLRSDPTRVLLLGDIGVFGFRKAFEEFSDRVYNVGILEQATVSMAAGMAMTGLKPVVHTIAPFLVERAYEQLKVDFGYQKLRGTFVSAGASYDYSGLGCTHHCPGDVNLIENIPGFSIFVPGHPEELALILHTTRNWNISQYIRLSEKSNLEPIATSVFIPTLVRPNRTDYEDRLTVLAVGPCLDMVLEATTGLPVSVFYTITTNSHQLEHEFKIQNPNRNVLVVEPYYSSQLASSLTGFNARSFSIPRKFIEDYGDTNSLNKVTGFLPDKLRLEIEQWTK